MQHARGEHTRETWGRTPAQPVPASPRRRASARDPLGPRASRRGPGDRGQARPYRPSRGPGALRPRRNVPGRALTPVVASAESSREPSSSPMCLSLGLPGRLGLQPWGAHVTVTRRRPDSREGWNVRGPPNGASRRRPRGPETGGGGSPPAPPATGAGPGGRRECRTGRAKGLRAIPARGAEDRGEPSLLFLTHFRKLLDRRPSPTQERVTNDDPASNLKPVAPSLHPFQGTRPRQVLGPRDWVQTGDEGPSEAGWRRKEVRILHTQSRD